MSKHLKGDGSGSQHDTTAPLSLPTLTREHVQLSAEPSCHNGYSAGDPSERSAAPEMISIGGDKSHSHDARVLRIPSSDNSASHDLNSARNILQRNAVLEIM